MNHTAVRSALEVQCKQDDDIQVKALLAPTEFGLTFGEEEPDEVKFVVKVLVGRPDDANEELVDDLFTEIPRRLAKDRTLGELVADASVLAWSGHRLFQDSPQQPPILGAEWKVKVIAN